MSGLRVRIILLRDKLAESTEVFSTTLRKIKCYFCLVWHVLEQLIKLFNEVLFCNTIVDDIYIWKSWMFYTVYLFADTLKIMSEHFFSSRR